MGDLALALAAALAIGLALLRLSGERSGVTAERLLIGSTPATLFAPSGVPAAEPLPVVVVAHGFAGSQQLMQPFALTFARNGYRVLTFDFLGHGRHPLPLGGSITDAGGATRALIDQTAGIVAEAGRLGGGGTALLGHSMASDIVIRLAADRADIAATIAVSPFSAAARRDAPRNLLLIVGGWEGFLRAEALKLVGQVSAPDAPREGVTYGDPAAGTARRLAVADGVEHVSVLYSGAALDEALAWLDATFGRPAGLRGHDVSGPWLLLLLAGLIAAVRPLSRLVPALATPPAGAALPWRRLWPVLLVPSVATPLILRVVPTHVLPVLVADYLAFHFALYGVLTFAMLGLMGRSQPRGASPPGRWIAAIATALSVTLLPIGLAIDSYVTSFVPGPGRFLLLLVLVVGALAFFTSVEWAARGRGAARLAYPASQALFLASLALAVALDFKRLFFLVIIVPVIVPFLLVFGLVSHWLYRRSGHPVLGGVVSGVTFGYALAVTFPLLGG